MLPKVLSGRQIMHTYIQMSFTLELKSLWRMPLGLITEFLRHQSDLHSNIILESDVSMLVWSQDAYSYFT